MNAPFPPEKTFTESKPLRLLIAAPRGFCAGVDRAIEIVERALEIYGAPVYVRHEIVHNKFVVDSLKAKGAVFVERVDQVPDGVPVIFSAHGVPKSVPAEASARGQERKRSPTWARQGDCFLEKKTRGIITMRCAWLSLLMLLSLSEHEEPPRPSTKLRAGS